MYDKIKVLAHLELFNGEHMRRTPFVSKYRPAFYFPGAKTKISGRIDLTDRESFEPGTSGVVQVTFIKGMISDNYFRAGQSFTISEGGKHDLGKGEILEVVE